MTTNIESKVKDILMIQYRQAIGSAYSSKCPSINENEIMQKVIKNTKTKGIRDFAIPKIAKTIRKQKNPLYYHTFSMDDIRFSLSKQMQTENDVVALPTPIKIHMDDECSSPLHINDNDEQYNEESFNELSAFQVYDHYECNESATSLSNTKPEEASPHYPLELEQPIPQKSMSNASINFSRSQTLKKSSFQKIKAFMKSPFKANVELDELSNNARIAKFMSVTKIHQAIPQLSKQKSVIKENTILKQELEQKKGCIQELTEENLKLSNEMEALQVKLDEARKFNNIEPNPKDMDASFTIQNMSGEQPVDMAQAQEFKELQRYEPVAPERIRTTAISKATTFKVIANATSSSELLVNEIMDSYKVNKKAFFKTKVTLKALLKMISSVYMGIILVYRKVLSKPNNAFLLKGNLSFYMYRSLLNKFGDKMYAKKKFKSFIATALYYSNIPRIHVFCGLMGLTKDIEETDVAFYIRIVGFMLQLKIGVNIMNPDTCERVLIPYVRAVEACRQVFQSSLPKELYTELVKKLEKKKLADKHNSNGAIEVDQAILIMLEQYHVLLGKIRDYIFDIFSASDLDKSNSIDFFEFYMIYKYIEPLSYSYESFKSIFSANCEYNGESPVITFYQFASICHVKNLFSEDSQNKFLKYTKCEEFMRLVSSLHAKFEWVYSVLSQRLECILYGSKYLTRVLSVIKESFTRSNSPREAKCVWMMYKFMENMSKELYQDRIVESVMGVFDIIVDDTEPTTMQLLQLKENGGSSILFKESN